MSNNLPVPASPGPYVPDCDRDHAEKADFHFFAGFDWAMNVTLLDAASGMPMAIPADTSLVGDAYIDRRLVATLTSDNNGVRSMDAAAGTALFVLSRLLTVNAGRRHPDYHPLHRMHPAAPVLFPTRLVVSTLSATTGILQPVAIFSIAIGDVGTIHPAYFEAQQAAAFVGTVTQLNNVLPLRPAQIKLAMDAWQAGSVDQMFASGVIKPNEGDPTMITWRDSVAPVNGAFDQLMLAWLELAAPNGPGLSPAAAQTQLTALRVSAAAL